MHLWTLRRSFSCSKPSSFSRHGHGWCQKHQKRLLIIQINNANVPTRSSWTYCWQCCISTFRWERNRIRHRLVAHGNLIYSMRNWWSFIYQCVHSIRCSSRSQLFRVWSSWICTFICNYKFWIYVKVSASLELVIAVTFSFLLFTEYGNQIPSWLFRIWKFRTSRWLHYWYFHRTCDFRIIWLQCNLCWSTTCTW